MASTVLECNNLLYRNIRGLVFQKVNFSLELGQGGLILSEPSEKARLLLRICSTLEKPTSGQVSWFGNKAKDLNVIDLTGIRKRIGWVHREARLVSNMTLLDNMVLGLIYHQNITYKKAHQQVQEVMELFGLYGYRNLRPSEVSYELSRLAIYVREIVKKPGLFLFEAPFLDLDEDFEMLITEISKMTKKGQTAFLMTDVPLKIAEKWIDKTVYLEEQGNRVVPLDQVEE